MGRTSLYPDRVRLQRFTTTVKRKEVIQSETPVPVTDWIPCLYRTPSGRIDRQSARDLLPENATLIVHHTDDSGDPVVIKEDDFLELEHGIDGTYSGNNTPGTYQSNKSFFKIEGEIVRTRAKRLVESYQLEIVQDKEF